MTVILIVPLPHNGVVDKIRFLTKIIYKKLDRGHSKRSGWKSRTTLVEQNYVASDLVKYITTHILIIWHH
jgi:hypothetical protein